MIIYYLDASAWVKRHQSEAGSAWMGHLWRPERSFSCAGLGLVEVCCAVARRHAAAGLPPSHTQAMLQVISRDYESFVQIEMDPRLLSLAQSLAVRRRLRGADCMHLAAAMRLREVWEGSVALVASDAELLAAAVAEGFAVLDPSDDPPLPAEPG